MGKSELAAAVALLLTCGDGEERGEVYGCAADRQQASIVFEVAADMVRMCPALNKRVKILASQKRIVYQSTNSFYQVLSAEAYSKHGFNIHGVVFDELHTQPNRKLFDVMTKGSGDARTQPLYFLITTAGTDTNSICYETHQKAKDIIEGRKIDPTFYPVIYGAEETDDWTDPKVWKKANPSLGITVSIDKVQAACDSAKQNPGEENAFRQLRLNQWVKQAVRWMPMDKWDACNFHVNEDDLEGRVCYGGLDLSSTTDITAFVLVFPPMDEDDKFAILPYFWIPEDTLELRVRRDHVPYDIWERQGFLQTTEGNVVHYGYIEKFIEQLGERFNIREIAFDRWGAVQMVQNLEGMEFTVVPFGQGFKDMSPPTKELMKLTLEQKLAHGGHPVLRWMMDNIFIGTGFKKWGMTTSNVAANIITDYILGNENKYAYLFDSTRMQPIKNRVEFKNILTESVNSLVLNKFKTPKLTFDNISNNSGGIIEVNNQKVGIYKDTSGNIFAVKPVCSHLGCLLSWNDADKTWDCPCHGSRFDYMGKNLYDPAIKDLEKYNL